MSSWLKIVVSVNVSPKYIFLFIFSSLSCNFNRCAVCFQSFMNIAFKSIQNAAGIERFLRLHIVIKPLNKKNKHNKSPPLIVLNIDWVQLDLKNCKIVKYRVLSEVCVINSTVSPQMWFIKSVKGWFTHPRICWQDL